MDKEKYTISVIIPHYNSFDYLINLISTIPENEKIQIIVVDDNSSDFNPDLIKRKNLTLLFNDSKGAGSARNLGLSQVKSRWVVFADADDYFTPDAFNIILNDVENYSNCELLYYEPLSFNILNNNTGRRHRYYEKLIKNFLCSNDYNSLMDLKTKFNVPWSKVISNKLIEKNNIIFDDVMYSNDVMFSVKSGVLSKNIHVSKKHIYVVTETSNSLTQNNTIASLICRYNVAIRVNSYLINKNLKDFQMPLISFFFKCCKINLIKALPLLFDILLKRQKIMPNKWMKKLIG
ncbi:glycosyltransferase family 2 protein [Vibrio parahaemolyticus]|uniref:glycosyltransferase n=2 Tax=Vibrio parahaemolyticus TaxID=670 RepID=UPI00146C736D|nr:glycosyltransferase family 2 protein [Vibrio parahaemolyticus]MBO0177672.1 glycosyltransferase family 2 protein [Vibrio parahaemolyticus]MBO0182754.1 glycosyltransferase family 2 protein [Vibrio parahaemolyticus]MDF4288162.1 glycosyltransferase family 2 protein [Vibrio parahaemolyticus]MDF4302199.1 glycosyltransferase family 2 protein [Vibrio parahaemolyticus]